MYNGGSQDVHELCCPLQIVPTASSFPGNASPVLNHLSDVIGSHCLAADEMNYFQKCHLATFASILSWVFDRERQQK